MRRRALPSPSASPRVCPIANHMPYHVDTPQLWMCPIANHMPYHVDTPQLWMCSIANHMPYHVDTPVSPAVDVPPICSLTQLPWCTAPLGQSQKIKSIAALTPNTICSVFHNKITALSTKNINST